ncbi:MAG: PaaI family thioesterase [Bacteroidetes bacterium]|nr:PaaI family thioesterase [Bacteroidota bacterium]
MAANKINSELESQIKEKLIKIPAFKTLGVIIESIFEKECIAIVPHNKAYDGIFNSYHGGMLMTAADTIAAVAVMSVTGVNHTFATTDMNIRFLAPCLTDVRVKAKVIKPGKLICPVAVDLYDMNDKLVAVAQVSYVILKQKQ